MKTSHNLKVNFKWNMSYFGCFHLLILLITFHLRKKKQVCGVLTKVRCVAAERVLIC